MTNLKFIVVLLSFMACNISHEKSDEGEFFQNEEPLWLTDARKLPVNDSLFYFDRPSPQFRKEFQSNQSIENATLYITAPGYYNASINGTRVGKNILDPAWTDFSKRIYYSEYDVTSLVKEGDNCIGVSLGNGFYNPLPLKKWGRRNLRIDTRVGKPAFLAKLVINYKNGKKEEIVSDESWKYSYGPIIKNSVYIGVVYNAGKELNGWNIPGYNDKLWEHAELGESPGGILQKAFFPPVQITQEITPVEITPSENRNWIVDMGINFTGSYKIQLSGNAGDTIIFRFGERLHNDGTLNPMTTVIGQIKEKGVGGPGAPDIAWQTDSYIFGDKRNDWFSPEFTYHTYRYIEIAGLNKKPEISDIKGLFMHSNVEDKNSFSCSSELLNSIQQATKRTFLANLVSVQSDCPAREKFAYGGDLNATCESFIYNFDMQSFYRKTIYDWIDAMNDTSFVDTAPFVGIQYCGISWESAYLITQYYLYVYYNDSEIVKELYSLNNKWMDKVARIHPDGLVDQGLSDHESMEPVPVQLTGTSHYLQCARIMAMFASVMEDEVNMEKYEKLAGKLQQLIKEKFWDKKVKEKINRQTLFSTLLYHGIVPGGQIDALKDSLLSAVQHGPQGHFTTGIFGTKYVLETLSEHVSLDSVFEIVNSTAYPGWGFMIDQGATTIWETWKESDNTYSNNHPMFGTVTEWYYRWLGGIRPDPDFPGFKEFILAPSTPEGLEFVNCTYHSPFGKIISNWKKELPGIYHYEWSVPENSMASITLPLSPFQKIKINKKNGGDKVEEVDVGQTGKFRLSSGDYLVIVSPKN